MTAPVFEAADIPDDEPQQSEDPTCRVCSAPLVYGGRGRKPVLCEVHKRAGSSAARGGRASADVDSALVTLGGLYDGLSAGLMFVSPNAASMWVGRIDGLQVTNRAVLTADRDLCRKINSLARGGGKFAFLAAHLMALAPVVAVVRHDLAQRATQSVPAPEARFAASHNGAPYVNVPTDPAGFFA